VNHLWQILKQRWLPATLAGGAIVAGGASYNALQQPLYEAQGQLSLPSPELLTAGSALSLTNTPTETLKSAAVVQGAIDRVGSSRNRDWVLDRLEIKTSNNNQSLALSYRDATPKQASQLLQALMEAYLAQDSLNRQTQMRATRSQLESQLPALVNRVRTAETNIGKFKESIKIADLTAEKNTLTTALGHLNREITKAKGQLAQVQGQSDNLKKTFSADAMNTIRAGLANESVGMQQVLATLQVVEQRLASERTRYPDGHTTIKDLISKQAILRQQVQRESQQNLIGNVQFQGKVVQWQQAGVPQEAISQLLQTETLRNSLEKIITALGGIDKIGQQRLANFPEWEKKLSLLQQDLTAATTAYQQLGTQLKSTSSTNTLGAQIVTNATPSQRPVSVPYTLPGLGILAGGLLGGGALAYGLHRSDRRLKQATVVQQVLSYPLLGCIPQGQAPKGLDPVPGQVFVPPEQLSALKTVQDNLHSLGSLGLGQVVLVTSATDREGKSTVATNLAINAAQDGHRVLLVDANLRQPHHHKLWSVSNGIGLHTVLTGETQFPESVVEVADNLELLVAGATHPHPAALFGSAAMAELIAHWFSLYDLVVVDGTTLAPNSEVMALAPMVQGLVLVVHPQLVTRADLLRAQGILALGQHRVLGMVINGVTAPEYELQTPTAVVAGSPTQLPEADFIAPTGDAVPMAKPSLLSVGSESLP
jgi:polysaccharide biosynthesis transport protein